MTDQGIRSGRRDVPHAQGHQGVLEEVLPGGGDREGPVLTQNALSRHGRKFVPRALSDLEVTGNQMAKLQDADAESVSDATSSRFSDNTQKHK